MRVTHLEAHVVAVPPPHLGGRYWILVRLGTACGIEGVGEIYAGGLHPEVIAQAARDVFERCLAGQDPHHVERLFRLGFSSGFMQRPDPTLMGIVSGLEIACWDIIGKAAGQPVYQLLGGLVRERIRSYTYLYPTNDLGELDFADPALGAACAHEMAGRGFTAVKFDPAGVYTAYSGHHLSMPRLDHCEAYTAAVREAVGSRCDLLIGTHGQMVAASAIRLAKRLEAFDPLWFEEPVPPQDVEGMARVAAATTIPIAAGERLTTKYEFHALLSAKAASIVQMNLGRVGGLLEAKKIAALADIHGAEIAPHLYNGPVGLAANLQLASCCGNLLMVESILDGGGFHGELLKTGLAWEQGYFLPPSAPGLGIEVDFTKVAEHAPYRERRLHLEMAPSPYDVCDESPARG